MKNREAMFLCAKKYSNDNMLSEIFTSKTKEEYIERQQLYMRVHGALSLTRIKHEINTLKKKKFVSVLYNNNTIEYYAIDNNITIRDWCINTLDLSSFSGVREGYFDINTFPKLPKE